LNGFGKRLRTDPKHFRFKPGFGENFPRSFDPPRELCFPEWAVVHWRTQEGVPDFSGNNNRNRDTGFQPGPGTFELKSARF
jgi:hypothetical protein